MVGCASVSLIATMSRCLRKTLVKFALLAFAASLLVTATAVPGQAQYADSVMCAVTASRHSEGWCIRQMADEHSEAIEVSTITIDGLALAVSKFIPISDSSRHYYTVSLIVFDQQNQTLILGVQLNSRRQVDVYIHGDADVMNSYRREITTGLDLVDAE